jgi:hypothetical protein
VLCSVGLRSDYRRTFWRFATPLLRRGDVESVLHVSLVAHHLVKFARECVRGDEAASFYAQKERSLADRSPSGPEFGKAAGM